MTSQSSRTLSRAPSCGALWSSVALLLVLCAPVAGHAQQSDATVRPDSLARPDSVTRPGTHTVKTGDTLWDLARLYLGDPFLWPEIYRLNTDVVEDPHWIYPGETLRLPGGAAAQTTVATVAAAQPADSTGDQAVPSDSDITEVEVEASGPTMFKRPTNHRVEGSSLQGINIEPGPAVRAGEYYAAPYVISDRDRDRSGRLVASAEMPGIASAHDRMTYQNQERIYLAVGGRTIPSAGDRFVTYRLGPDVPGIGQVAIPTGIVVVERPGNGEASTVRIVRQFDEVQLGQQALPLEEFVSPARADLLPVETGPTSRIAWIQDNPNLTSLQRFFIVSVGAREGVKLGDEFEVFRERTKTDEGVRLPAEQIALARVVRVTDRATTLVVTGQRNPAIREGARARLAARMP